MANYMEGYGAGEEKRNLILKRIFYIGLPAVILCVLGYFYFRTWPQERIVSQFIRTVQNKDYDGAYKLWCTDSQPCRYYPIDKFKEDWGPTGAYANVGELKFESVDYCNGGVVFETTYPNAKTFGLFVEQSTGMISFAPWQRCPGKHLQLGPFFKKLFG